MSKDKAVQIAADPPEFIHRLPDYNANRPMAGIGLYQRRDEIILVRCAKVDPRRRYAVLLCYADDHPRQQRRGDYLPNTVWELKPNDRVKDWELVVGQHLWRVGTCAWCGYDVTDEKSVVRGLGPQCLENLHDRIKYTLGDRIVAAELKQHADAALIAAGLFDDDVSAKRRNVAAATNS